MPITLISKDHRYKGNMHCHSTLSDGRLTVEELACEYKKHGYSFVAFSDHNNYYEHNELSGDGFVAINAYEQDISKPCDEWFLDCQCYHLNFFAKTPEHRDLKLPEKPDYTDIAGVNAFIRDVKAQGFLCSYNHPYWSLQNFDDYRDLDHIDFVEVYNHGCYVEGWHENQINVYDDMVRWGKNRRLFCTMTDDNHNVRPIDGHLTDSFGGWVMARAERLDYVAIIQALEKGDFYCSSGPVIKELTYEPETKTVTVKTSDAFSIACCALGRGCRLVQSQNGEPVNEATFTLGKDIAFRIEVLDGKNGRADTNYFFPADYESCQ